ncbi:MAG: hypothetical protein L6Q99_22110 [Planctomycetes bacterium]|nr:hypothetical protein [Planctomycetota bacterium]
MPIHRSIATCWALGVLAGSLAAAPRVEQPRLRIDPLLVAEARAVWELASQTPNPLWPDWEIAHTPILVYLPGVQDVLIGHPAPPAGFVRYSGTVRFGDAEIWLRDGPTFIEWDGQNTSRDVAGVRTLVLADTLSNRKQDLRGWFEDPRPTETKLADLGYEEQLLTDPYEQLAMAAHEAFHVFQDRAAPDRGANELDVRLYPCLSVQNNVEWALEGDALAAALRARDADARRRALVPWLALRLDRRAALREEARRYEDGNEFAEGLAKYVEWRLFDALEGRTPPEALWLAQGFHGFDDLDSRRERLIESLVKYAHGEVNVNNDPYGTSPIRGRLYYSGMALGALLDELAPRWKQDVFAAGVTLTELARRAIDATDDELAAALAQSRSSNDWKAWETKKSELERLGRADTERLLAGIERTENTLLEVDVAELADRPIGLAFTGYGVRALDEHRTIYTLVPIAADFGSAANGFEERVPTPTYEDRERHVYRLALAERLDAAALAKRLHVEGVGPWVVDGLDVELPGVRVRAERAEVAFERGAVRVRFRRAR